MVVCIGLIVMGLCAGFNLGLLFERYLESRYNTHVVRRRPYFEK